VEQTLCLETLRRIEGKLQVIQAMVIAKRPQEELLSELMAAQEALSLVEEQVVAARSEA